MQGQIQASFANVSKCAPNKSAKLVVTQDVFLAIEACSAMDSRPIAAKDRHRYVRMPDAMDAHGGNPADQTFMELRIVKKDASVFGFGREYIGLMLGSSREEFVPPHKFSRKTPFTLSEVGSVKVLRAPKFTSELAQRYDELRFHRLQVERVWYEGTLDTFRVKEVISSWTLKAFSPLPCELLPILDHPAAAADGPIDLLSMHANVSSAAGPPTADPNEEPSNGGGERDVLSEWLEALLTEHGDDDAEFVQTAKDSEALLRRLEKEAAEIQAEDQAESDADADDGVDVGPRVRSLEQIMADLGLEDRAQDSRRLVLHRISDGKKCATIHKIAGQDRNIKSVCGIHSAACKCWVDPESPAFTSDQILKDMLEWIAGGFSCSEADHKKRSVNLRIHYGHKVRGSK